MNPERIFLMNLWRDMCGLPELESELDMLRQTEWSTRFEGLMRNRLLMGAYRYGVLHQPGKPVYNRIAAIIDRAERYDQTGNLELLVDIANLALLEFEEGTHPCKHFRALDDAPHVQIVDKGGESHNRQLDRTGF